MHSSTLGNLAFAREGGELHSLRVPSPDNGETRSTEPELASVTAIAVNVGCVWS